MKNDILKSLNDAFGSSPRPKFFNKFIYDDKEFKEHDDLLQKRNKSSLTRSDLGSVGWNPVSTMNVAGWRYWLPTLGKIAIGFDRGDRGLFMSDFLIYLGNPRENETFIDLTKNERTAIYEFLEKSSDLVKKKMEPEVEFLYDLLPVIQQWKEF